MLLLEMAFGIPRGLEASSFADLLSALALALGTGPRVNSLLLELQAARRGQGLYSCARHLGSVR